MNNIQAMKCDIILPVCDQYEFTKNCIESIVRNTDTPYRIIVINNGKNADTRKLLDELERNPALETTIIHNDHNIGWVKALNRGIDLSDAPYVCFQNDDTVVTKGWLRKMIEILNLDPRFGVINPSWEGRSPSVSIDRYNEILERKAKKRFIETDWGRGFSVVIKREVVEKIGKVDEIYGLAYFDDVDYSVTATEAGFLCLKALDTYVYHHRNVTFFEILKGPKWNELHEKNKLIYYKKWGKPLRISIILDKGNIKSNADMENLSDMIYHLARKQHRVYVWHSDKRFLTNVIHTNVILKTHPLGLLRLLSGLDLHMNSKRKPARRYDAVFVENEKSAGKFQKHFTGILDIFTVGAKEGFASFVKKTADGIKEKTKEYVNAQM